MSLTTKLAMEQRAIAMASEKYGLRALPWLLGTRNKMDTQLKRIIDLSEYNNVGIILKLESGVSYTSQVAGYACQHPEIEGAFYPLPVKPGNAELLSLTQRFKGPWNHIEEADAEFIDRVLRRNGHSNLTVDRAKLDQSYEAWVHLLVGKGIAGLSGFSDCEAVLTWPNSD